MLKIRLQRIGRKHEPVFRLVVIDSHEGPKSGNVIEILGSYDSRRSEKAVVHKERVNHWLSKGAKLSDTLHNMFVTRQIISGPKKNVLSKRMTEPKKEDGEKSGAKEVAKEQVDDKSKDSAEKQAQEALDKTTNKISEEASQEEKATEITS